ncbi:hypothetical protein Syun_002364 [Stephania yunnanensis]|uniref:Alpha/beta hydrolase fold-3 domain-containing protein n=1 Tax=Stephania yunnanensis TaxID=152371 RepID=A0AAP0LLB5_9MAGN
MSSTVTPPHVVDDVRGVLQVYSDGSIIRLPDPNFNIPIHDDGSVIWKDVIFDAEHNLNLRLYKPNNTTATTTKLPVLYYIHGGGFCIGSRTWPTCQNYCLRLASHLRVIVVSPDYRLSPENRLPAAIDDGFLAVKWLQDQALLGSDNWLADVANFDRVFISGDSAGGNIAHHLMVRFWRLSIPVGETTDHPIVNPFGSKSPSLENMTLDPVLVVMGSKDLLKDRAKDYAERLKSWGHTKTEYLEFEEQQHGFFTIFPDIGLLNKGVITIYIAHQVKLKFTMFGGTHSRDASKVEKLYGERGFFATGMKMLLWKANTLWAQVSEGGRQKALA